jgi:hypothetical protein
MKLYNDQRNAKRYGVSVRARADTIPRRLETTAKIFTSAPEDGLKRKPETCKAEVNR